MPNGLNGYTPQELQTIQSSLGLTPDYISNIMQNPYIQAYGGLYNMNNSMDRTAYEYAKRYYGDMDWNNNQNTNNSGLAGWANLVGAGSGIMSGIAGIGNMINSFNAMDLARDQYNFQKRLANRNIANQAKIINNTYDNAANVATALSGQGENSPLGLANRTYAQRQHVADHL